MVTCAVSPDDAPLALETSPSLAARNRAISLASLKHVCSDVQAGWWYLNRRDIAAAFLAREPSFRKRDGDAADHHARESSGQAINPMEVEGATRLTPHP